MRPTALEILQALKAASQRRASSAATETRRKSCPRCQQRSDDGLLCQSCCKRVKHALTETLEWWPDLWQTITRQSQLGGSGGGGKSGHSATPLVFDSTAADLADVIRATLVGWVKVTLDDLGAPCPADRISSLCDHLTAWLPQMRKHPAAVEMADELLSIPPRMRAAVDYPDERARIPIGPCPESPAGEPCPGSVHTVLFEDTHTSPVMRCDRCGTEWLSFQWRRAAKRIMERAGGA